MNRLWIAFVFLATYVSIYPFDFDFRALDPGTLRAFLDSGRSLSSRGDILGNVVLFVPFGVLGMLLGKTSGLRIEANFSPIECKKNGRDGIAYPHHRFGQSMY